MYLQKKFRLRNIRQLLNDLPEAMLNKLALLSRLKHLIYQVMSRRPKTQLSLLRQSDQRLVK